LRHPLHCPLFPYTTLFRSILALSADGSIAAMTAPFAVRPGAGNFGKAYAVVIAAPVVDTPTLSGAGLLLLALVLALGGAVLLHRDRKSTRLNSSHLVISYA